MGFAANGKCFGTAAEAAQSACSSYPFNVPGVDGALLTYSCSGSSVTALSLVVSAPGLPASRITHAVSFAPCDEAEPYRDMGIVWALGLVAAVGIWCVKSFVLRLVSPT